jgi:hypothetical protein
VTNIALLAVFLVVAARPSSTAQVIAERFANSTYVLAGAPDEGGCSAGDRFFIFRFSVDADIKGERPRCRRHGDLEECVDSVLILMSEESGCSQPLLGKPYYLFLNSDRDPLWSAAVGCDSLVEVTPVTSALVKRLSSGGQDGK